MILGSFAYSRDAAHYDGKEEERECAEVLSVASVLPHLRLSVAVQLHIFDNST
jgi:hypothetical protein